jgi:hypothetical protein
MDMYREHPSDFDAPAASEARDSEVSAIGTDERRMHVRAYNYWASLLEGRDYPSIEDLEPGDLLDFAPHSVLLDFTSGGDEPATPYIGAAIREECGLPDQVQSIAQVPSRSLLSRLTDHYMQIIANRAPVGFEAEFENQRDETICYRGILMPFSSDGDTIDFIYGVINWKKLDEPSRASAPLAAVLPPIADEEEPLELNDPIETVEAPVEANIELDDDAGLADRLWAARESVEALKVSEGRSREALYRALSRAYDFAIVSKAEPGDYAELLDESGVKAQARAPMTPIVKLVFGIDCDKARLTEYAAALSYAERQGVGLGGFLAFIETQAGGLKALVGAERQARRPEPKADSKTEKAREKLRTVRAVALDSISSDEEFALVLTRRSGAGVHEAMAVVEDAALIERAIRQGGASRTRRRARALVPAVNRGL